MELCEMIKVMQHFEVGGEINFREKESGKHWRKSNNPCWNWNNYEYQIKKPNVTIENWLIKDVESGEHFIIGSSDIELNLKEFPEWKKVKLIKSYEVEL